MAMYSSNLQAEVILRQSVRCPTCGHLASRELVQGDTPAALSAGVVRRTTCSACDYFMEVTELGGKVLSAYF